MRRLAWTGVWAFVALFVLGSLFSVSEAAETCVVGDAVTLEAGFTSQAPSGLSEVSWTYHWPSAYFTLKSIAQADNVYADNVPSSLGPDFGALQIRWVNDGTATGPVNAEVELEAVSDTDGRVITLPTPEVQALDTKGRAFDVEVESELDVLVEPRPVLRWYFRLGRSSDSDGPDR